MAVAGTSPAYGCLKNGQAFAETVFPDIIAGSFIRSRMVRKIFVLLAAFAMINLAFAQSAEEEDYEIVLPDTAQACILPAAPDAIPEEAAYEDLVNAKKQIAEFQSNVEVYRACLQSAEEGDDLTAGNKQALISSFNYTVDMEERIAERFNAAVRGYKEREAAKPSEGS
jgi:hypothetical protein